MKIAAKHKLGPGWVLIWNKTIKKCIWTACKITSYSNAIDRKYRINVELNSGIEIDSCAPECVTNKKPNLTKKKK